MRALQPITAQQFKDSTGAEPIQDDLERCNCPTVGTSGHYFCGWNYVKNVPMFVSQDESTDTLTLEQLERLWLALSYVPVNEDAEIEESFLHFDAGTDSTEIWHWFESKNSEFIVKDHL